MTPDPTVSANSQSAERPEPPPPEMPAIPLAELLDPIGPREPRAPVPEIGGRRDGTDPTRYGDWEKNGRCIDF